MGGQGVQLLSFYPQSNPHTPIFLTLKTKPEQIRTKKQSRKPFLLLLTNLSLFPIPSPYKSVPCRAGQMTGTAVLAQKGNGTDMGGMGGERVQRRQR